MGGRRYLVEEGGQVIRSQSLPQEMSMCVIRYEKPALCVCMCVCTALVFPSSSFWELPVVCTPLLSSRRNPVCSDLLLIAWLCCGGIGTARANYICRQSAMEPQCLQDVTLYLITHCSLMPCCRRGQPPWPPTAEGEAAHGEEKALAPPSPTSGGGVLKHSRPNALVASYTVCIPPW